MSSCIFCPTKQLCTDADHALQDTESIVYKLRGVLHGIGMSRDNSTYAEKFEDAMLWVVSDLVDEIDERMTVVDTGYRAVRKQLEDYRDGGRRDDDTTIH